MTLEETAAFIAEALEPMIAEVDDLQIEPFLLPFPTPPAIDVYPAFLFMTPHAQGLQQTTWTVRARTHTADHRAASRDLFRLMETSAVKALLRNMSDDDLDVMNVTGPTGFQGYTEPLEPQGLLIGCEWEVTVVTEPEA